MDIDPAVAELRFEIEQARAALLATLEADPEHPWSARELKAKSKDDWTYGAANLALTAMVDDGTLVLDGGNLRLAATAS